MDFLRLTLRVSALKAVHASIDERERLSRDSNALFRFKQPGVIGRRLGDLGEGAGEGVVVWFRRCVLHLLST